MDTIRLLSCYRKQTKRCWHMMCTNVFSGWKAAKKSVKHSILHFKRSTSLNLEILGHPRTMSFLHFQGLSLKICWVGHSIGVWIGLSSIETSTYDKENHFLTAFNDANMWKCGETLWTANISLCVNEKHGRMRRKQRTCTFWHQHWVFA